MNTHTKPYLGYEAGYCIMSDLFYQQATSFFDYNERITVKKVVAILRTHYLEQARSIPCCIINILLSIGEVSKAFAVSIFCIDMKHAQSNIRVLFKQLSTCTSWNYIITLSINPSSFAIGPVFLFELLCFSCTISKVDPQCYIWYQFMVLVYGSEDNIHLQEGEFNLHPRCRC